MTPVGLPGLAALAVGMLAFLIALIVARTRREPNGETGVRGSRRSIAGIAIQSAGFAAVGIGRADVSLDPLATIALAQGVGVAATMIQAVAMFVGATRAMGSNWGLVARTRADHRLVTTGPFACIRHPIYSAMFLVLMAIAIALGHATGMLIGVPLFSIGTWMRVREEERLLRAMFGAAYDDYARRVKRFVPGIL